MRTVLHIAAYTLGVLFMYSPVFSGYSVYKPLSITKADFSDIHFPTKHIGYIVGSFDSILKTQDAGMTWTKLKIGSDSIYSSVCFIDDSVGFVISERGVHRTRNGGQSWETVFIVPNVLFNSIAFHGDTGVLTSHDRIYHTKNAGKDWKLANLAFAADPSLNFDKISFGSGNTVYVAARISVLRSEDGGANWIIRTAAPDAQFIETLDFLAPEDGVFACPYYGGIWRIRANLPPKAIVVGPQFYDVAFETPTRLFAVSRENILLFEEGEGKYAEVIWTAPLEFQAGLKRSIIKLKWIEPGIGLVIGKKGLLYRLQRDAVSIRKFPMSKNRNSGFRVRRRNLPTAVYFGHSLTTTVISPDGRKVRILNNAKTR